jgi:hypothetical protein
MKPLLVGDHPTRAGDRYWTQPLSGVFARNLCRIAGWEGPSSRNALDSWAELLYSRFECINAWQRHPHGGFNVDMAAGRLSQVINLTHEVVVLLGARVQKAYVGMTFPAESPVDDLGLFEWIVDPNSPSGRREVVVLPAPAKLFGAARVSAQRQVISRILNEAVEKAAAMQETRL